MKISKTKHITKKGVVKKNPTIKHYRGYATKEREAKIDILINHIQESAYWKIREVNYVKGLINERMSDDVLNSMFWNFLSTDKESGKLFRRPSAYDPTLAMIYIDIDALVYMRGNELSNDNYKSVEKIKDVIRSGKLLDDIPKVWVRDLKVGEGNHRVQALKELGYKSCPVHIFQTWDR